MIDPLNPGPAGTDGPAGVTVTGPTPQYVANQLQAGATAVSQATAQILGVVTAALQAALSTVQGSVGKLATAVTTQLNAAQTTADLSGLALKSSVGGQLAVAGGSVPVQIGGPTTGPNHTEGWNLWSVRDADGWGVPIAEQWWTSYTDGCQFLFRGWALQLSDAQALAATLPRLGKDVRPECFPTIVTPPTGVCPPGVTTYRVWELLGGQAPQCAILCSDAPAPGPNWVPYGVETDLAGAQALVQTLCGTPVVIITPPTSGGPVYYGGCLSGKAVTWDPTQTVPVGVTNVVGPFPDQASALAAAGTCIPPPPPPTVGTGQCCGVDPTTGALILPTCIKIDLCDWSEFCNEVRLAVTAALNSTLCDPTCFVQPFCDCLKKTLCEVFSSKECASPFQDAERYIFEDQDNTFAPDIQAWTGNVGRGLSQTSSLDDMASLPFGG